MINEKKAILQLDKPEIVLDELSTYNIIDPSDQNKVEISGDNKQITTGSLVPFININSYNVKIIDYMKINMNTEIPEILLVFRIKETHFLYSAYPKDGDLLCLYIKSTSKLYKPIRHDYTIIEVTGPGPDQIARESQASVANSVYYKFIVKAQLRIPKLYQNSCKAFSQKTSFETLRAVAKELKLGFSSNENDTSDKMTWVCPNQSNQEFIDTVVNSAWKGEEDAFQWWIDPYYNLTFVNMNKQLFGPDSAETDSILAAVGPSSQILGGFNSNQEVGEYEFPLLLTNDTDYSKYPFFIKSYTVSHGAGYVVNNYGYKTLFQFYDPSLKNDDLSKNYVSYAIESMTPKELGPNEMILRGRVNEKIYEEEYRKYWGGTIYAENMHENLIHAPVQNEINRMENYKIFLTVELGSYAPWIYRGQMIPVRIVHKSALDIAGQKGVAENAAYTPGGTELNTFLSGKYIILGTALEYKSGELRTILTLGKRRWSINPGPASEPEPIIS